jgi:hypothetical protein
MPLSSMVGTIFFSTVVMVFALSLSLVERIKGRHITQMLGYKLSTDAEVPSMAMSLSSLTSELHEVEKVLESELATLESIKFTQESKVLDKVHSGIDATVLLGNNPNADNRAPVVDKQLGEIEDELKIEESMLDKIDRDANGIGGNHQFVHEELKDTKLRLEYTELKVEGQIERVRLLQEQIQTERDKNSLLTQLVEAKPSREEMDSVHDQNVAMRVQKEMAELKVGALQTQLRAEQEKYQLLEQLRCEQRGNYKGDIPANFAPPQLPGVQLARNATASQKPETMVQPYVKPTPFARPEPMSLESRFSRGFQVSEL